MASQNPSDVLSKLSNEMIGMMAKRNWPAMRRV